LHGDAMNMSDRSLRDVGLMHRDRCRPTHPFFFL
jgi:hypothetical protein